jgi:hypothetical protein
MILSKLYAKGIELAADGFIELSVIDLEHKSPNQ